jgi:hypothetical protein
LSLGGNYETQRKMHQIPHGELEMRPLCTTASWDLNSVTVIQYLDMHGLYEPQVPYHCLLESGGSPHAHANAP